MTSQDRTPPDARSTPIAIVGMSCLFPKAQSLGEYWANIKQGVDAITDLPPTHWNPGDYHDDDPKRPDHTYGRRGGFLSPVEFDPAEFGISPHSIAATDTSQLLGLVVAQGALRDAGYGPGGREFDRDRASVILGVTGTLELAISLGARLGHPIWRKALKNAGVDDAIAEEVVRGIGGSYVAWQEDSFPGLLGNVVAGRIANRLDLGGTNCVVDAACASSISAAHLATLELATGRADLAITGGVDTFNDIFMYMCFSKTPALSPTGDARPFDAGADGTILGEGIGMVVLKRLADAERDGDKIYAVIKGIGTSSDGRGKAVYAPCASGQTKALEDAYARAGVTPDTVGLVEAHGTGTKVGDATEVTALQDLYRKARPEGVWCALGSVKSQIGHTKAAAGVAGMIKAALALRHKVLPPSIKVTEPNPAIDTENGPFYVNNKRRPWLPRRGHPRRAAVSAFGFGGSNFHMLLEEFTSKKLDADWDGSVQIVALSSETREGLHAALEAWDAEMAWDELRRRAREARRTFSSLHEFRMIFVLERGKTAHRRMARNLVDRLDLEPEANHWSMPEGAYFGASRRPRKLAFLFPGQGSQYVGMCLDLAVLFPKMQRVLTQADLAYGDVGDLAMQLSDFIFPHATYGAESRKLNDLALRATHVAQPAIGAVSMGALCVVALFGLVPDAVAGHSFGELMAMFASGRIDAAALHDLSKLRGELMAKMASDEAGSMLAVGASAGRVRDVMQAERLDLTLANINAPDQVVLSGRASEIERAAEILKSLKLPCTILPVAAAFHSALVAEAAGPFREALASVPVGAARVSLYANTTGERYPDDPDEARDLLGVQLARPVEFARMIESMYADGARTFVEVGPGRRLTGLVRSTLGEREHEAIALDASAGEGSGIVDLARLLARLGALGHAIDLKPWDTGAFDEEWSQPKPPPRMKVMLSGANVRPEPPERGPDALAPPAPGATVEDRTALNPLRAFDAAEPLTVAMDVPAPPPKQPPRVDAMPRESEPQTQSSTSSNLLPPLDSSAPLGSALRATQENLKKLQTLQEETARLHRQFLEGQERAQQTFERLIDRQFALLTGEGPPIEAERREAPPPDRSGIPRAEARAEEPELEAPAAEPPAASALAPDADVHPNGSGEADGLAAILLEVVSEKTGYPPGMLKLDMDIESDLGIDSIKRVEILSSMQERAPGAPVVEPDQMGRLRTLGQIVEFLCGAGDSGASNGAEAGASNGHGIASSSATNGHSSEAGGEEAYAASLIAIVSDKTGYPAEMLGLEMDVESDLGIDSIKRVEILSAFQEAHPEAAVVKPEDLGRFRTLGQIIEHVSGGEQAAARRNGGSSDAVPPSNGRGVQVQAAREDAANGAAPDRSLREYVPQAKPAQAPGGAKPIELARGKIALVAAAELEIAEAVARKFGEAGVAAQAVSLEGARAQAEEWAGDIAGLVVIGSAAAACDDEPVSAETDRAGAALELLKQCAPSLRANGREGDALFVTVSWMDGRFGLDADSPGPARPIQGALAGLAKTAAAEWPEVSARALDIAPAIAKSAAAATFIVQEALRGGALEAGLDAAGRHEIELTEGDAAGAPHSTGRPIASGDVVIVTGGARGVTAEAAVALAEACRPTLVLLGRSPAPGEEPAWLEGLTSEIEIKRAIAGEGSNGSALNPARVEREYQRIAAGREIRRTLARIERAGARAVYRRVDVRDAAAVAGTLDAVRSEFGSIDAIVHGAGVLRDRKIEDKTREDFDAVFETKVAGLDSLLRATRGDELKAIALFSSVSGRFGRAGQADYAMANEALNKIAQAEARRQTECRVIAINWGPWDGGMVTPGLRKVFEAEGVDLIPMDRGARWLAERLTRAEASPVEVVVGGRLGIERRGESGPAMAAPELQGDVAFERDLDIERHPFLASHVIGGRPVLPMAMTIEWLAHGALHGQPGMMFQGFEKLRILKGVTIENGSYRIRVIAGAAAREGAMLRIPVELTGGEGFRTRHARAEILLAPCGAEPRPPSDALPGLDPWPMALDRTYDEVLFHGEQFQVIESVEGTSEHGIAGTLAAAPEPQAWMTDPLRSGWIAEPGAIDGALQLAILWTHARLGAVSLPMGAGSYRQFVAAWPAQSARAVLRASGGAGRTARFDVEWLDAGGRLLARMDDLEMVVDESLTEAFRARSIAAPAST